jgi:hypothetical protein
MMQSPVIRYTCAFFLSSQLVYRLTQPMQVAANNAVADDSVYLCFLPVVAAGIPFNAADAGCSQ